MRSLRHTARRRCTDVLKLRQTSVATKAPPKFNLRELEHLTEDNAGKRLGYKRYFHILDICLFTLQTGYGHVSIDKSLL